MRNLLLLIALATSLALSAQEEAATHQPNEWFLGTDFNFYFDNNEASGTDIDYSGTMFFARLSPYVGLQINQRHRLTFGIDMRQDFGDSVKFVSDVKPLFFYSYRGERWQANAGVFQRSQLCGTYTDAIFDGGYAMDQNKIQGLSGAYCGKKWTWEGGISWDGMYSSRCREQFRIFSAGHYDALSHFYLGYNAMLTHLAKSDRGILDEGVVDYFVANPYIGTEFKAYFDFDVRLHAIVGYQNDRIISDKHTPVGGQLDVVMSRWGFSLRNHLYLGQNQLPFYEKYGSLLYAANEFYATKHNIFNHTMLEYEHTFCRDMLSLYVAMEASYEGTNVALQQVLSLKMNIEKVWKMK